MTKAVNESTCWQLGGGDRQGVVLGMSLLLLSLAWVD
jgi:hypothetical protein